MFTLFCLMLCYINCKHVELLVHGEIVFKGGSILVPSLFKLEMLSKLHTRRPGIRIRTGSIAEDFIRKVYFGLELHKMLNICDKNCLK